VACDAVKQPAPADEAERRSNKGAAGVDGQDFADIEARTGSSEPRRAGQRRPQARHRCKV
jgi:hypothetical protein